MKEDMVYGFVSLRSGVWVEIVWLVIVKMIKLEMEKVERVWEVCVVFGCCLYEEDDELEWG